MRTKIIEVEEVNKTLWGKFMIGVFDDEWGRSTMVEDYGHQNLLQRLGWVREHILIVDLSVGHGAIFHIKSYPVGQVAEKGIYFCPMMTAFVLWLSAQDLSDLDALPDVVELAELGKVTIRS